MARFGQIKINIIYDAGTEFEYVNERIYNVYEIDDGTHTVAVFNQVIEGSYDSFVFLDVNLDSSEEIGALFFEAMTEFSYTWLQELTEVPDDSVAIEYPISIANGGTGATTAAQALVNIGAAPITALDALSDIVAGKANASHEHTGYATTGDVDALEDAIGDKANASHTHSEYSLSNHIHDDKYYTEAEIDSMVFAINSSISDKANSSHAHTIADITNLQSKLDVISDAINGKADSDHSHSDYSLNTHNHDGVYSFADHTHNYAASNHGHAAATTAADGFMSAADKIKLGSIAEGAEVNQNAFSNVVVGSTTIVADAKTDSLILVGSNVTLTPDATNDKVIIGITKDNVTSALGYTPPTTNTTYSVATQSANGLMSAGDKTKLDGIATGANNYTLPTATSSVLGGVKTGSNITNTSGTISLTKANVTSALGYTPPTTNTTYNAATTSAAGLMSAADKTKLDGIATGANKYTLPTAGSSLGGVKTTSTVTSTSGYTACPIISGVPYYKDTNSTYSLSSFGITATAAELNYCDGVTSNIQTQLNGKAASSHTHSYLPLSGGTVNGETNIAGLLKVQGQQAFSYSSSTASQAIGTNNATGGTTICCGANADVGINGTNLRTSNIIPKTNNASYCGNANFRWKGIYSTANVNVSSDERLKENIESVNANEAMKLVNNIDVKSFNYIDNDASNIGVIAQDIIRISPEMAEFLVEQDDNGYYGVKTSDLVFPLIATVQQLAKEIEELKAQVS